MMDLHLNVVYTNLGLIINLILSIIVPIILLKIFNYVIHKFVDENSITSSSLVTLNKILRYIVVLIIFLAVLEVLGIDLHSLIVSLGLVSLAVTLAAKDSLSNVISGIIILLEKRFVIGDMIEIDGHKGQVKKIGFKSVELLYKNVEENTLLFVEKWKCQKGLDKHMEKEVFIKFGESIKDLLASELDIQLYSSEKIIVKK